MWTRLRVGRRLHTHTTIRAQCKTARRCGSCSSTDSASLLRLAAQIYYASLRSWARRDSTMLNGITSNAVALRLPLGGMIVVYSARRSAALRSGTGRPNHNCITTAHCFSVKFEAAEFESQCGLAWVFTADAVQASTQYFRSALGCHPVPMHSATAFASGRLRCAQEAPCTDVPAQRLTRQHHARRHHLECSCAAVAIRLHDCDGARTPVGCGARMSRHRSRHALMSRRNAWSKALALLPMGRATLAAHSAWAGFASGTMH